MPSEAALSALPTDLIARARKDERISTGLLTRAERVVVLKGALWTVKFERGRWFFVPIASEVSHVR